MSINLASLINEIRSALGETQINSSRLDRLFSRQHSDAVAHAEEQAYIAKLLLRNHERTRFLDPRKEQQAGRASARTAAENFARQLLQGSEKGRAGIIDVARDYYAKEIQALNQQLAARSGDVEGVDGSHESIVMSVEFEIDALNAELARLESVPYALNALGNQRLRSVDDLVQAWERLYAERPDLSGHELLDNDEARKALEHNELILSGLEELIARDGGRLEHLPEALAKRINRGDEATPTSGTRESQATKAETETDPAVVEFLANYQKDLGEFEGPATGRKKPDQPVDPKSIEDLTMDVTAELLGVSPEKLESGEVELPHELLTQVRSLAANNLDASNNDKTLAHDQLLAHLLKSEQFRPVLMNELRNSVVMVTQLSRLPESLLAELNKVVEGGPMSESLKEMIAKGLESGAFPPETHQTLLLATQTGQLQPSLRNALIRAAGKNDVPDSVLQALKMRLAAPQQISRETRNELAQALKDKKIPDAYVPAFEKLLKDGRLDQAGRAAVQRGLSNKAFPPELNQVAQDALDAGLPEQLRGSLQETVENKGKMPEQLRTGLLLSTYIARLPTNVREQLDVALTSGPIGKELGAQLEKLKSAKLPEGLLKQIDVALQSGTLPKELKDALQFSRAAEELPWALRNALTESSRPNGMNSTQAFRLLSYLDKHGDDTAQAAIGRMFKKNADGSLPALSKDAVLNELMASVQRDYSSFSAKQQAGQAGPLDGGMSRAGLNAEFLRIHRSTAGFIR